MADQVIILGAGPAGLSAALWLKNLGIHAKVLERSAQIGGMLNFNGHPNDWILGLPQRSGQQIGAAYAEHAALAGLEIVLNTQVSQIAADLNGFCVTTNHGALFAKTIILATGTRFRTLPGVQSRGNIINGAHFEPMMALQGQNIAVIGGGDNAFENALLLASQNRHVTIFSRSAPCAQKRFVDAVAAASNISLVHAETEQIIDYGDAIEVLGHGRFDRCIVLIGYDFNFTADVFTTDIAPMQQANGALWVDALQQTSTPGIYAAGDIAAPVFPSVVSAVAQGAVAAKAISQREFAA